MGMALLQMNVQFAQKLSYQISAGTILTGKLFVINLPLIERFHLHCHHQTKLCYDQISNFDLLDYSDYSF